MNKCEKCGGLHWRTAPCVIRKESTATPVEHIEPRRSANVSLPVDNAAPVAENVVNNTHGTKPLSTMGANPTADRPVVAGSSGKFDKKEWQKIYMREHRMGIRRRVAK